MDRGFLGYDASLMLDVVVCALVLIVPALAWSVWQAQGQKRFVRHRNCQILLTGALLTAVLLFELDMRLHGGWQRIVNRDLDHPRIAGAALEQVRIMLFVHLGFAISTPILWGVTIALALRRFSRPPEPGSHSQLHKRLGWLSVADLVMTSITGLLFYYMAFVR